MRYVMRTMMVLTMFIPFLAQPIAAKAEDAVPEQEVKKEEKKDRAEADKKNKAKKEEKALKIDEVVVTATRTEKDILDVPASIEVITKEDIEKINPMKITDVFQQLSGMFITDSGSSPQVSIRGTRTGASGGAYVMIDGIPIQMGKYGYAELEGIPPGSVERIEIVKGSLSALYGGDAARGVINIITKKGEEKPEYKASGMVGSYGDVRYGASARGAGDKFDYSAYLSRRQYDGYRHGAEYRGTDFLGNVGYSLDDFSRLGMLVSVDDLDRKISPGLTKEQEEEDRRQSPYLNEQDLREIITGLSYDRDTEKYLAKASFYYKDMAKDYFNNKPNTGSGNPDNNKYSDRVDEWAVGLKSQFGIKTPLFGRANTFIVGFDADLDNLKNKRSYLVESASHTKAMNNSSGDFKRDLYGVFMQDELNVLDPLTLTLGLRYDLIRYDFNYWNKALDESPHFDKLNPKVGLTYRFTDKNSAYFSYSNAYRPGTLYDYTGTATYSTDYDYEIKPEHYTDFELGYRQHFNEWLFLDANLFYTTVKDEINYYYIDGKYAGSRNYGKTIHQGAEVTVSGNLFDRLGYRLSYAYLDTDVKEGKTKYISLEGKEIVRSPNHTLTAMLDYLIFKNGLMGLNWHFDVRVTSCYFQDMANTQKYPGYGVANTKLEFAYKWVKCFIGVNNIFDKEYDGYAGDTVYYYPAPDRTYVGGLSFEF